MDALEREYMDLHPGQPHGLAGDAAYWAWCAAKLEIMMQEWRQRATVAEMRLDNYKYMLKHNLPLVAPDLVPNDELAKLEQSNAKLAQECAIEEAKLRVMASALAAIDRVLARPENH
jgi:hypothetical protein